MSLLFFFLAAGVQRYVKLDFCSLIDYIISSLEKTLLARAHSAPLPVNIQRHRRGRCYWRLKWEAHAERLMMLKLAF